MAEKECKYIHSGSRTLAVTFGCLAARQPEVPSMYGFVGALGDYDIKKMHIKDSRNAWFLRGIVGIHDDTIRCASAIKLFARMMNVNRIFTIGSSMGAYGALLYGQLLKADVVLAFGPQTAVDPASARFFRDGKIKHYGANIYPHADELPYIKSHMNLANKLEKWNGKTEYHVFRSTSFRMDRLQIDNISDCPHVHAHLIPEKNREHNIASFLRGRGELQKILEAVIGGESVDIMGGVAEVPFPKNYKKFDIRKVKK